MRSLRSGLVDIVRDFFAVHRSAEGLVRLHADGSLRFEDVEAWVGGDARSELFRLKERCHSIFRPSGADETAPDTRVGALVDLAVGSLFHEAMKLRENLYQRERYGPRVQALRQQDDAESQDLFEEFEKILDRSSGSLDESVAEIERLVAQIRTQLLRLIAKHGRTGLVARCLYETAENVRSVYPEGLDSLYEQVYGDPAEGYVEAARSYLESAYYSDALAAFTEAARRSPQHDEVQRSICYAEGMEAFFSRDYARSVKRLSDWLDAVGSRAEPDRVRMALAGTSHVERLPENDEAAEVIEAAAALSKRLRALAPA
jgi:tetratricopeptide (TPR) repeat protein